MNAYDTVNASWGRDPLPPITRDEAARAARKLMRRFAHVKSSWLRRCWISTRPTNRLDKGWARLAHDVSHRAYEREYRAAVPRSGHSRTHAALELAVIQHIVASGWLDGSLRPKVKKVSTDERRARALAAAREALARWQRREKLSKTKVQKYRRRIRTLERRIETA